VAVLRDGPLPEVPGVRTPLIRLSSVDLVEAADRSIDGDHLVEDRDGSIVRRFLGDPADPAFLRIPGGSSDLRRAAFAVWARHVREAVAAGRTFETTYRAPRPVVTTLTMVGAASVTALCALILWSWIDRPQPAVEVRATTGQAFMIVVAVAVVVGMMVLASAALVRAWRCRGGGSVEIGPLGLRITKGRSETFGVVVHAEHHGLLRCTRIAFVDGRADLWIPDEPGPLRRLDLLLAAMDDRLGSALAARL
jgi:hypothetical protein